MTQHPSAPTARTLAGVVRRRTRTFTTEIRKAADHGGTAAGVREAAGLLLSLVTRPVYERRERTRDRRLRLDTGADSGVWTRRVESPVVGAHHDGVAYSPTPLRLLCALLRRLPIERPSDYAFIDLGCGKGRTLFVAAEHGFRRIIGVEMDPELATIARANIDAYAAIAPAENCPLTVEQCDAAEYAFPAEPAVIFLFNPFGADTLRAVLANLHRSLSADPRPMVVAYYNPVHRELLDAFAPMRAVVRSKDWAIYRTA